MRARLVLVALIAAESAAVAVVATRVPVPAPIDWRDPWGWVHRTDPETATLVIGRLVALGIAAWLLGTTLVAAAAHRLLAVGHLPHRLCGIAGRAGRVAPAMVRHVVEAACSVGLVAATIAPAGAAVSAPDRVAPAAIGRPRMAPLAPVRDGRAPTSPTPAPPAAPPSAPTAPAPTRDHHRVAPGEHLWGIAEAIVTARGAADPVEVDRYWRALCDANRDRLASGDPNLLAPGEDLDLPPVA